LDHDARVVCLRAAAPTTREGQFSPFHKKFDPFWARVNEAGVTVAVHAGDSGYHSQGFADEGFEAFTPGSGRPSVQMFRLERAAHDFLISSIFDRLFERFPNLRIASVENGSAYLKTLLRRLKTAAYKSPGYFKEDPTETFKQHIWINPFWEDDSYEVIEMMGADRVIFGSDWPHVEGMPQPLDYVREIKELGDEAKRLVMHDNAADLTTRRPA
jgi:predicted TIM-barrel fold metal-dependent hydrolase